MLDEVSELAPLEKDEKIISDTSAYLEKGWKQFKANTVVLKRVTNKASIFFVYEHLFIENGLLVDKSENNTDLSISFDPTSLNWATGAHELAKGLASLAPPPFNALGAGLIGLIFPNDNALNWETIYTEIRQIITEALNQHTLHTTNTKISGIINWLNFQYNALKNDPEYPREKLQNQLMLRDNELTTDVVSLLMDPDYRYGGFANFLVAAGVHLGILQEQALISGHEDPRESGFAKSVKLTSERYIRNINDVVAGLITRRLGKVSGLQIERKHYCHNGGCGSTYHYYFTDSVTGYRSPNIGSHGIKSKLERDYKDEANKRRNQYIDSIRPGITNELQGKAFPVRDEWQKLVENPIPIEINPNVAGAITITRKPMKGFEVSIPVEFFGTSTVDQLQIRLGGWVVQNKTFPLLNRGPIHTYKRKGKTNNFIAELALPTLENSVGNIANGKYEEAYLVNVIFEDEKFKGHRNNEKVVDAIIFRVPI